jgi:hypothetical protein
MNWILGKLVDLINWMADTSDRKALGRDIPSASLQGRADAPRLPDGHFTPDLATAKYDIRLYGLVFDGPTPDRPDPYISQVRKAYTTITGAQVASRFPEGS